MTEMQKNNKSVGNVPNLRFPEFEGEWETKNLGEVTKNISSGKSKNKTEQGEYPFYGSTGIIAYSDTVDYFGDRILIARVGANAGFLYKVNGKYLVSDNTLMLDLTNRVSIDFLYYYLLKINLNQLVFGSGQPLITAGQLKSLKLYIPTILEQQKIGSFLSLIDEKIQTQNKIIENLKTQMLGLQEKIFKQKIKLKNTNDGEFSSWDYKKGGELFESIANKNHNSDLPILAVTQDKGAIPRDLIDYQITVADKSIESYKVVEIGDFIISLRSFQGGIEFSNYMGICSPAYIILRNKIELDVNFYKYYLKTPDYIKLLNKKLEGIRDGKMISYAYFSEIELPFPAIEEQNRIASFLSKIDQKIETEKSILQQLEIQKKYLLQQMFV